MKKTVIIAVVIIAAIFVLISLPREAGLPPFTENLTGYTSSTHDLSFSYPKDYVLTERDGGIILIKEEDSAPRVDSEGPTAITFSFFPNTEKQSLSDWFRTSTSSNSNLAYDTYVPSSVAGSKEAITYRWSGLYEGESIVFEHKNNIVMMSVTYLSPEDRNIPVFKEILATLKLE